LLEHSVKHIHAFIAPSRFCKEIHHSMGFNEPMVILPNFVPALEVRPLPTEKLVGRTPAKPYFLFVGRLEEIKGAQTLIPIFRHYQKADLLIAGTGTGERRLRRLAGDSSNIRFLGYVPERELQTLYRHAVAVLAPSVGYEVFSLVVLEAFRQKTPAIVRKRGGMPELIDESGGGFVYDTDEELLDAMERLMDPASRRKRGLLGYEAFQRKWTAEAHLKSYFALIDQIAAQGHASASTPEQESVRGARIPYV
jgi:glycosyltransferase involved in cell wall biosynthesis